MNDSTNLPVHREQMGAVSASVWMNQTESGEHFYVTTLSRTYRDPDTGEWRDSNGFGQRDLLVLAHIAQRAAQKISELTRADRRARSEDAPEAEPADENANDTASRPREAQRTR